MNRRKSRSLSRCTRKSSAMAGVIVAIALGSYSGKSSSTFPIQNLSGTHPALVLQTGHSWGVNVAVFAPDGSWIASGGADNSVKIWQTASGRELRSLNGHRGYIRSLARSSNGQWLASGSSDRDVKLWEVATARELHAFKGHTGTVEVLAFSADYRWLASGGADGTIKIWDPNSGREIKSLSQQMGAITSLAFSGDGQTLVSGSANSTIQLWNTSDWGEGRTIQQRAGRITALTLSPDRKWFASGSADGSICLWPNGSGRERCVASRKSSVRALAFGKDESLYSVRADGGIERRNLASGKESELERGDANAEQVVFASFSPDLNSVAWGNGGRTIELFDLTLSAKRTFENQSTSFNAIDFSEDGRWFAVAASDSSIRLWQVATGRELSRLSGHSGYVTTLSFSKDSRFLASGSRSGEVKLWDLFKGRLAVSLPSSPQGVNTVAFSPDGKWLAAAGMSKTVELWNLETKKARTLSGHKEEITSVVFSVDGRLLASGGRDKTIRIWDLSTGAVVKTVENLDAEVNNLALSRDGSTLAAATANQSVVTCEFANCTELRPLKGHDGEIFTVAFSPDGRVLASAGSDHQIKLWDPRTGGELRVLTGPTGAVNGVVFSQDGRWVLSASDDGSLMVWNAASGALMATLVSLVNTDDWLVATPDGLFDGSPTSWNLMLWRFDNNTFNVLPVEAYFNEFYSPGVLAEIFAGSTPKAIQDITRKNRRQPQLRISVAAGDESVVVSRTTTIKIEIAPALADQSPSAPSGARDLRLFRNGLLVKAWTGDVLKGADRQVLEATIPVVAGENRLSAYAFNSDNIKSVDATLLLTGADGLKRAGTAYVLAVGVAQYENAEYNLNYPVADAAAMEGQFKDQQGRLKRYQPIVTISLVNSDATKKNILLALARLAGVERGPLPPGAPPALSDIKPAQPEDAVVIYFSGHGMADKDRFYLIPHDLGYLGPRSTLDADGVAKILAHSISDVELEESLRSLDADQLLLVIDACQSGQALNTNERRRGPMNTRGLAQLAYEKGMYILTASQSDEAAFESEKLKHSYLAFALIEEGIKVGSADTDRDGQILLQEWFAYATERVPQIRRERTRGKELVEDEPDEQKVQRPRVFYTRESGAKRLVIARISNISGY